MAALARRPATQLAVLVVAAAAVLAVLALRVRDWVVMTDEMQYAKLATALAHGEVVPTLRGVHVSAYAQLYPALLSPLYGFLSAPSAFHAAHVLNAILIASAAIPAYLLAREIALPPRWSLVSALLSIAIPWTVLAAFILTESAAYPVFLWALLACQRALVRPSPRRDAIAVAALVLAVFARTQFLVLGVVLPLAALLVDGRRAPARHRVLTVACIVGALVVAVLGTRILGSYGVTATQGSVVSWKMFEQAGAHLDLVAVGMGLMPLLLGGAWLVDAAWKRDTFALLALVTVVAITLEASSYDVRFPGGLGNIRGRYMFYVGPLLVLAMLRLLYERRLPRLALAGATLFFAVSVFGYEFPRIAGLYVDTPVAVVNDVIQDSGGRAFVALLAIVLALLFPRIPQRVFAHVIVVVVFAASVAIAATAWERLLRSNGPSGRSIVHPPNVVYDWVDTVLPHDASVGLLAYPVNPDWGPSAILWWDVEFWNDTVDRAYVVGHEWDYAPFPHVELRVDPHTGSIAMPKNPPTYIVSAEADARLHLVSTRVAYNYGLAVLQVERPWRVDWATSGLDDDGWSRPGRPAAVHVFAPRGEEVRVDIQLVTPDNRVSTRRITVCVPSTGSATVRLPNRKLGVAAPLPLGPGRQKGPRIVGPRVGAVALVPSGNPCS